MKSKVFWITDFDYTTPSSGLQTPTYYLTNILTTKINIVVCILNISKTDASIRGCNLDNGAIVINSLSVLKKYLEEHFFDVIVVDVLNKAIIPYIYKCRQNKIILFARDSLFVSMINLIKSTKLSPHSMIVLFLRTLFYEVKNNYNRYDAVLFCNNRDTRVTKKVFFLYKNKFFTIKNGVKKSEYINCNSQETKLNSILKFIFVGPADYFPNYKAVELIVNKIAPLYVLNKQIQFVVIGKNYTNLFDRVPPNVIFKGFVDNLTEEYISAYACLAPIYFGSGIKNKVLEAMSYGLPVVGTPEAFSGILVSHRENAIICKNIASYKKEMDFLIRNPAKRDLIGSKGKILVINEHSWDRTAMKLIGIIKVISKRGIRND